ncbi:MAG: ATP-binding protein, partial [Synergistaceae bacterium]|nr:ATP-binding protein [Synergistaceae bacterium]
MIKALPENVWTRIAAGEVVERPASAVKELVENSLDAGATQIRVSLSDGGRQRIIVQDNGSGIAFDELPLALMYHATSKISEVADLENIMTLGYRGEALASIASVADVEIRSRQKGSDSGGLIRTRDGKITEHIETNCNIGTRIQVDNLFSALPARRKFLKSDNVEFRHIVEEFQRVALTRPEISFTLSHNGKDIYILKPAKSLKYRIMDLMGPSVAGDLVDVFADTSVVSVRGFAGRPDTAK